MKTKLHIVIIVTLSLVWLILSANGNVALAAPLMDYEGFGAVTKGALDAPGGYETYHVTSLADSGPGTLRDALSQGSRYIVFDVGGTITLSSSLNASKSYVTIAGETAPYPGITIIQPSSTGTTIMPNSLGAHDIIIRYLRNIGPGGHPDISADIWGLDGEEGPVYNIIIDHVTAIASEDGVFDITYQVSDVTLSWNLVMDTELVTLIKYEGGKERISIHHNVFARGSERQPQLAHEIELMDFVNNVVYGWGWNGWGYGLRIANFVGDEYPTLNFENNVYHYVSGYSKEDNAIQRYKDGRVYFNGNIFPPGETDDYSTSTRHEIPAYAQVTMYDASTLGDTVVPFVGTHYPTPEEQDLLNEVSIAIGGHASNQAPTANAGSDQTITDSDGDGSEQVTLDGSGSTDSDGTIESYVWTEGGTQIATGVSPNVTLSTGQHTITLTVTDDDGASDTDTVAVTITDDNTPPVAIIQTDSTSGEAPLTVNFDANGSYDPDPDGSIVGYSWDFGDGSTSTGMKTSHIFTSAGEYTVTLTVTDDHGWKGKSQTHITVFEKEFGELPAGCYNNVFNPAKGERSLIIVELPKQARVRLNLYNTRGKRIKQLADEQKEAGTYKYYWDGKSGNGDVVGSGLYFIHIQAGDYKKTKKIVVVK